MAIFLDPIKGKRAFVVLLICTIVILIGGGVLGYFYYQEKKEISRLSTDLTNANKEKDDLKKQLAEASKTSPEVEALKKEKTTLEGKITKLEGEKTDQANQTKSYQAKIAKANAYNEFYKYVNYIIEVHNGFTGWTDAEFQVGKTKAEATGNTAFVSTVNWAWYETSVPPTDRVLRVWKEIAAGIESSLK